MVETTYSVLLIDDDPTLARIYTGYLAKEPYQVIAVETGTEAMRILREHPPDAVLLDVNLPDMSGFDILENIAREKIITEVVIITGHGSVSTAVRAMQAGARDFLMKPFNKDRLLTTLRNCLEHLRLRRIIQIYQEDIDRKAYCGFVGSSLVMQGVYRIIDSAARSRATVFITGESGTGKEVCAEAVHRMSARAGKPFVALNCGAIPKDLIESELFGHVKGAFTGAIRDREGAAKLADGGTLFLDEICEMDISLQPKLLRFLQTGLIQRVGDNHPEAVDVRIICATNRDPMAEVKAGRYREDLYYRLHVLPMFLPPLREREGDVAEIAAHFLDLYAREEGRVFAGLAPDTLVALQAYDWPGNVRQLQNVIRNIVVLHQGGTVTLDMLPQELRAARGSLPIPVTPPMPGSPVSATELPAADGQGLALGMSVGVEGGGVDSIRSLADLEREAIENAIRICRGNVPRAAHFLGISAATVYRKKAQWLQAE
ncbi:Regulatory protein LuxO [uncultured Gammaproteobacteria bacterium]